MTTVMERVAAGELVIIDGGTVDRGDLVVAAEGREQQRAGGEGVGDDHLGAGLEVGAMDPSHEVGPLEVRLRAPGGVVHDAAPALDLGARAAVRLAREATAAAGVAAGVAVAGSISTMQPVLAGDDRTDRSRTWTEAEVREHYRRKAGTLAEAGVDVLVMEMMRDTGPSVWATEAAMETGLPVWVGLSFEVGPDGGLVGWGRPECAMDDVIAALTATGPDLVAVMHTSDDDTGPALTAVRSQYRGPLGAYPESGRFAMPEWVFVDVIGVDELVDVTRTWIAQGVTVVGGCCGVGPEHIAVLAAGLRT